MIVVARARQPVALADRKARESLRKADHVPSEAELIEMSDRWRRYRSLAVSYLFAVRAGRSAQRSRYGDKGGST